MSVSAFPFLTFIIIKKEKRGKSVVQAVPSF
jgi:hypothetical protein